MLEKFPRLRVGVIALGAVWVPAWLERLEIVRDTFGRSESRIGGLPMRPTDYARRPIRVTPYPTEDVGRLIDRAGPELFMSRRTARTSKAADAKGATPFVEEVAFFVEEVALFVEEVAFFGPKGGRFHSIDALFRQNGAPFAA